MASIARRARRCRSAVRSRRSPSTSRQLRVAPVRGDVPFLDGARIEGVEVVEHGDVIAVGKQRVDQVAADEAGAAGDECLPHLTTLLAFDPAALGAEFRAAVQRLLVGTFGGDRNRVDLTAVRTSDSAGRCSRPVRSGIDLPGWTGSAGTESVAMSDVALARGLSDRQRLDTPLPLWHTTMRPSRVAITGVTPDALVAPATATLASGPRP